MEDMTVVFTDPLRIDLDVFNLWLEGCTEAEGSQRRLKHHCCQNVPYNILYSDTVEQYQVFKMLEKYLQSPPLFNVQMLFTISPNTQQKLIEKYYGFDKEVVREFLGKKMSAKLRKDLDDVSEKTGIPLSRCKRQFDNVKNVLKAYEDSEGSIHETVTKQFLIPDSLARTYSCMLFIFVHRFETGKKRLAHLTFDNFVFCADQMLHNWLDSDQDDLDRDFFQDIREIRNFTNEKEVVDHHKSLVFSDLEKQNYGHLMKSVEPLFKGISRNIFSIGYNLTNNRDVRDFFIDLTEKVVDPLRQVELSLSELDKFLGSFISAWDGFAVPHSTEAQRLSTVFKRYTEPIRKCLLEIYHS